MSPVDFIVAALLIVGVFFYAAGTVGLLRFPDAHTRLHALTKADNLGLGFIVLAAALHWGDPLVAAKLVVIWLLAVFAAGIAAQLVARSALNAERER